MFVAWILALERDQQISVSSKSLLFALVQLIFSYPTFRLPCATKRLWFWQTQTRCALPRRTDGSDSDCLVS